MIITSHGISSTTGVSRSLRYISRDGALTFTQNLFSDFNDIEAIENEFFQNFTHIKYSRGKNLSYSETLSMPIDKNVPKERQIEILKELITVYTKQRGFENHLGYFAIHTDRDHSHAHCLYSANAMMGTKRKRISKKQLLNTQKAIEKYRNSHYPQLTLTHHYSQKLKRQMSLTESRIKHMRGVITKKEKLTQVITHAMQKPSLKEFHAYLKEQNLQLYIRGKKTIGLRDIKENRKYRLNTLKAGLRDEYLQYHKRITLSQNKSIQQQQRQSVLKPSVPLSKPIKQVPIQTRLPFDDDQITPPSQHKGKNRGR